MKKTIALFFLASFLTLGMLDLTKAQSATTSDNYPQGILYTDAAGSDLGNMGQAIKFPGGKVKSNYCMDSGGYESFPSGTLYKAESSIINELSSSNEFMQKYPTAFQCNGNPRFFFGGDLITSDSNTSGTTTNDSSISGLQTTADGTKNVNVSWQAVSGATSYTVKRDSGTVQTTSETAYIDKDVPTGDHTYTVTALDTSKKAIASAKIEIEKTADGVVIKVTPVAVDVPKISDINLPKSKFNSLAELLDGFISWLMLGAAGASVLGIAYSGIMYITASGDTEKAAAARKNLTWAIMGLIIMLTSYVIVQTVADLVAG